LKRNLSSHGLSKAIASIALNAVYLMGGRGLTNVVRFVYSIVLARFLGPELYGLFNYGMSWYLAVLPIAGVGLSFILSREVGRDRTRAPRVVAQTLLVRAIVSLAASGISVVAVFFVESDPHVRLIVIVFSAALAGRSLSTWSDQVFTAFETNKYYFVQQAFFRPFEVVAGIAALYAGFGVLGVTVVHAISWWVQAVYGITWVCRRMVPVRWEGVRDGLGSVFWEGVHLGIGLMLVNWLQQAPVVLYRQVTTGEANLGQLALAMQVFMVLYYIPVAAGTAALPVLSRSAVKQDGTDLFFVKAMLRAGLILGAAAGLIGIAAGPPLVTAVFGSRYAEAGRVASLVVWLLIPWTCADALYRLQLARGKFFVSAACAGAGAAVLTLSLPFLVSVLDLTGAVLAAGAGMTTWAALSLVTCELRGKLDLGRTVCRPVAAVAGASLTYYAIGPAHVWLAVLAGLAVLFGGVLLSGTVAPDEREALSSVLTDKLFRAVPTGRTR
jgi:O-antigen/teichoic acid export membrane protein